MADEEAVVERESSEEKRARQDAEKSEQRKARQVRLGHVESKPKAASKAKGKSKDESEEK
jgi:hypothetical protein